MSRTVIQKEDRRRPTQPATVFARPWMAGWVEAAAAAHSVKEACDAVGVSLADYHRGRLEDPAFDAAALVFDQVLDLLVLSSVRNAAIGGDARAQVLYYGQARLPAFVPAFPSWSAPESPGARAGTRRRGDEPAADPEPMIDPRVAEAMVAAGLEAATTEVEVEVEVPAEPASARRRYPPAPR